ncbi:MAG: S41 family peptidase [Erysipelotrichaceae bacterium]
MENKFVKKFLVVIFSLLCAVFFFCGGYLCCELFTFNISDDKMTNFERVYSYLMTDFYYGENSEEYGQKLIEDAIKGMVNAQNDIHTEYMTADELSSFTSSLSSSFVGIGVTYQSIDGQIFVKEVIRSSPAEAAGVLAGDVITQIDGVTLTEENIDAMVETIAGEIGTVVNVTVKRGSEILSIDIVRQRISNTVFSSIKDGIGVLTITSFADGTAKEVKNHLDYLKENNVDKLVIDLRDNTGGYASTLDSICSLFMDKGDIVMREYDRYGNEYIDEVKNSDKYEFEKIAIIINDYSASCSEVFTLAMIENCSAITVGETSYGKGVAQITTMLADGSALKYTDLIWKSGNGVFIGDTGIEPDYPVYLHDALYLSNLILEEDEVYGYDQVSEKVAQCQTLLDFLGYQIDREDGYLSKTTETALKQFQIDNNLTVNGKLDKETANELNSAVVRYWVTNQDSLDTQLQKALELVR